MARTKSVEPPPREPEPLDGPWRVRVASGVEGLERALNALNADGYAIDEVRDLDPDAVTGELRFLVFGLLPGPDELG